MSGNILIVRMPCGEDVPGLSRIRDYILESLPLGVVVVDESVTFEVMELPILVGVAVVPERTELDTEPDQSVPTVPEPESEGEEKRAILQRLQDYRKANGGGCLIAVARATRSRGKITDNTLRMLLTGDIRLEIEDWRRIGRALDRLEAKEALSDG